ncbi:MAG: cryptochrome/photolyase family protein [Actinobacteria bacterium]|nr:cryptochrome/photolyase family protein [Actinomycetota bacterium]|tara:strand:- start:6851 stop:8389 length:1539 start_codon:yes stop_codon:yes gene_type:complete
MTVLRFIFGDQLNLNLPTLRDCASHDLIFMTEVKDEATHIKHHKKKLVFVFSCMRHFLILLKKHYQHVVYSYLTDSDNTGSFRNECHRIIKLYNVTKIILTEPSDYRVYQDVLFWQSLFNIPVEIREDTRFICSKKRFKEWTDGKKQLRMEFFYREMRQEFDILMKDGKPIGGTWNYDKQNRKPPKKNLQIPTCFQVKEDSITQDVKSMVNKEFSSHFGDIDPFFYAVTRDDALSSLDHFIKYGLAKYGSYQDAMLDDEPFMFHSLLSFYLNCGLLSPLECILAVQDAYYNGDVPINSVEGFIRQVLGWREYIRGIYWLKMPKYKDDNYLEAKRSLPKFFWTANTTLNCLKISIENTKENAYAHHIQRLMVLGNFSLLAGLDPHEVNEWYHIVYADAYEWVELPNVSGMVLFADGGVVASKPYAASGSYIKKMSNYCDKCQFSPNEKLGEKACPFNYLYWNFFLENKIRLSKNPRLGMVYRTLSKFDEDKQYQIQDHANKFLVSMYQELDSV